MPLFIATANLAPGPYQEGVTVVGLDILELPVFTPAAGIVASSLPHRFEFTALGSYDVELVIQSADTGFDGAAGVYTYADTTTPTGSGTFVDGTGGFYSGSGSPPPASPRFGTVEVTSLPTYIDAGVTLGGFGSPGRLTGPGENGPGDLGTRLVITQS